MPPKTVILGTAGHIDHGKTTLVKALTGIDTDRLKEEKERGITIELGFAYLDLPSGTRVGIVDVPGHERFVKNMVAGATGMDLVALVVAADEGIMPQTEEHLEICQLLGVKKGLVVLTKKDMVEEDWLELVKEETGDFLKDTFLEDAPIIPVSSVTGEGIDDLIKAIESLVEEVPERHPAGPYRLPVDRVFSSKGFGTVVTGTSISGEIRLGDEVFVYPRGKKGKLRGIQTHGKTVEVARPGLRTALNIQGIDREEIKRGDVVAIPNSLHPSYLLDLRFFHLKSAQRPLRYRSPVRFHAGTAEVMGRVLMEGDEIRPGAEAFIQIKLEEPVALLPGDHYVIRSYSPIRTIGGGIVLNPLPRRRKRTRPDLWKEMETLNRRDPQELICYHLEQSGIRGLTLPELSIRTGLYGKGLEKTMDRLFGEKKAIKLQGGGQRLMSGKLYREKMEKAVSVLSDFHKENPLVMGLSKEELKSRLFASASGVSTEARPFNMIIADLEKDGKIVLEKDMLRLSSHKIHLGEEIEEKKRKITGLYKRADLTPPSMEEAIKKSGLDGEIARNIFDLLERDGILVKLKEDIYFHASSLEKVKELVVSYLKKHGEMGVPEFRDILGGLSRKYMIPLLEYLDNQKITLRVGDKRKLRGSA